MFPRPNPSQKQRSTLTFHNPPNIIIRYDLYDDILNHKFVVAVANDFPDEIGAFLCRHGVSFAGIGPNHNDHFGVMLDDVLLYHGQMPHMDGIETTRKNHCSFGSLLMGGWWWWIGIRNDRGEENRVEDATNRHEKEQKYHSNRTKCDA